MVVNLRHESQNVSLLCPVYLLSFVVTIFISLNASFWVYQQSYESLGSLFHGHVSNIIASQELVGEKDQCSDAAIFGIRTNHLNSCSCFSLLTKDFDVIQGGEQNRHA